MKTKFIPLIFLSIIAVFVLIFFNRKQDANASGYDYLRIHINANSCSEEDSNVKLEIRDKLVNFLIQSVSNCKTKNEAYQIVENNLTSIEAIANATIQDNKLNYGAKAELKNEYFPSRCYENCVLDSGMYDALVITLGEGGGDNWWCVVYPPMCFVNKNSEGEQNIVYQSKIVNLIKKYFK